MAEGAPKRVAHFRLLKRLGAGGMGVVYRCRDEKLGRDVALKLIHGEFAADTGLRRRLLREARAAAAVTHSGFPTIYEVSEDDGRPYIAMELLDGHSLRDRMHDLDAARALEICAAVAQALGKAHDAGIVHRDVKPENVFITSDGRSQPRTSERRDRGPSPRTRCASASRR